MIRHQLIYLLGVFIPLNLLSQQGLEVTLSKKNKECLPGNASVAIRTGSSPFQITWSNGSVMTSVSDLEKGEYWVTIKDNTLDDTTIFFTIEDLDCLPNASTNFTPNGDGFNDEWAIGGLDYHPDFELFVYNRWGQEVHQQKRTYNPWNGTSYGLPVPDGTYYYILYLSKGDRKKFVKGDVSILR